MIALAIAVILLGASIFFYLKRDVFYVYKIVRPEISAEQTKLLARELFGFEGSVVELADSFIIIDHNDTKEFIIYKISGGVEFVDHSKYASKTYSPTLPDDETAKQYAISFLNQHGLMPPDPLVFIHKETISTPGARTESTSNAITVVFESQLQVTEGVKAPVRDGEVVVWIGDKGEVIRLQKNYRDVEKTPTRVPRISDRIVRRQLASYVKSDQQLRIALAYLVFNPDEPQTYLDPVFEYVKEDNIPISIRVPATSFTPQLSYLGPDPAVLITSGERVMLRADALRGRPPYKFKWASDIDGLLGQTKDLNIILSPGIHNIQLTLIDANGSTITGDTLLHVIVQKEMEQTPSSPTSASLLPFATDVLTSDEAQFSALQAQPLPFATNELPVPLPNLLRPLELLEERVFPNANNHSAHLNHKNNKEGGALSFLQRILSTASAQTSLPTSVPIASGQLIVSSNGVKFYVLAQETRPIILNSVSRGGYIRAGNIYFDHFRYELDIDVDGSLVVVKSKKCFTRRTPGTQSCFWPQLPFAISNGSSGIFLTPGSGLITEHVELHNLPGKFAVDLRHQTVNAYCGESPWYLKPGVWVGRRVGVIAYPLGGHCPGIKPELHWTYQPPHGGGVTGKQLKELCVLGGAQCEGFGNVIEKIKDDKAYQITDFRARLEMAAQSNEPLMDEKSSFAQDTAFPGLTLSSTIGPVDRSSQPLWALRDTFTYITPVPEEMFKTVSHKGARGQFDNIHMKSEPTDGIHFPGCNNPRWKGVDQFPCLHLHESWYESNTYSEAQTVAWFDTIFRRGVEESPTNGAQEIVNPPEALVTPLPGGLVPLGKNLGLWIESRASSKECGLPGGTVDNTTRPCIVFRAPIFFTPR